jgi:endonuclease/exonuclease/phosphatase family metal-dependent hydrolase
VKSSLLFLGWLRKGVVVGVISALFPAQFLCAQILMSGGTYSQNFDSLAGSGTVNWTNNLTLSGWYAAKGSADAPTYIANAGTTANGSIYSFGSSGVNPASDRALGSVAASSTAYAYGIRFTNDTTSAQTNITVSYTGEQWRNANLVTNTLAFSYQISNSPLTNADAANAQTWISFNALNFNSPSIGGGTALDGNAPANRQVFINIVLVGVIVQPGQEIFLRWRDVDDTGSDAGIALDDLTLSFQSTTATQPQTNSPVVTSQPQSVAADAGGFAIFSASATGNPSPSFQWQFNNTNLPGATSPTLALNNLTTNQAGNYSVVVTNSAGVTNSISATLLVTPVSFATTNGAIRILQYNVEGNGATDWSTNAPQVQAIGRELMFLNPDIITFNEIPSPFLFQMTNWVAAFLPGYFLATNSFGDTFIQNVIASRFPITRSASHLHNSNLDPFGYTASNFTRDLFEAQIAVPNWPQPLHVFVAHLKSTGSSNPQDDANKRAAEASAVSNYFAVTFLTSTNATHPYILDGDMNEDAFSPDTDYVSGQPIQRLTSAPTGLQMTIPINPVTRTDLTESIQGSLDTRFDYILPCSLLLSNITGSEVFRTDLLNPVPPNLNGSDDMAASDHLPVLMVFNNPFDTPFKLLSIMRTNQNVTLQWESQNNRNYNIEASSDLFSWLPLATNIMTTNANSPFVFTTNNISDPLKFFRIRRAP